MEPFEWQFPTFLLRKILISWFKKKRGTTRLTRLQKKVVFRFFFVFFLPLLGILNRFLVSEEYNLLEKVAWFAWYLIVGALRSIIAICTVAKKSLLPLFQKATVFRRVLFAADVFETVTLTTNLLHFACKILRNTLLPISPALKRKFTNSCGYYLWPTTICEWSENCYFTSFECECENGETFSKCKTNLLLYFLRNLKPFLKISKLLYLRQGKMDPWARISLSSKGETW